MSGISRRTLLGGGLALTAISTLPLRAAEPPARVLTARSGEVQVLDVGGPKTRSWGYDGQTPGPVVRVRHGEPVLVQLKNSLEVPTTIHWHGIRNENAMDGVSGLTQPPVAPGEAFTYRFTPPDAGTFWYHPHHQTWEQMARGLYGFLIVEEKNPPQVDRELLLAFDDWRVTPDGQIHTASFGNLHDLSHGGRLGNYFTVNGQPYGDIPVQKNERIRVRMLNASNARVLKISFAGLAPRVIAIDGQPIAPDSGYATVFEIAPAQRIDVMLDMVGELGSEALISEVSTREPLVIGKFLFGKEAKRPEPMVAPIELEPVDIPRPDPENARKVPLVMEGGAMGGLAAATYKGEKLGLRDLAIQHGKVWAFNGQVGMSETPLFRAKRGEHIVIVMDNKTAWPHAMHVHGHHFKVVSRDGGKEADPHWWDTILMDPREKMEIGFVADNPGKWMLHCHMLEHQSGGMGTWFEVA